MGTRYNLPPETTKKLNKIYVATGMQSIKTIIFEKSKHKTLSDLESSPERSSSSNGVSGLSLQRHTTPWSWFKKLKPRNAETWDKSKSLLSKSRLPESELSLNYLNKLSK